jgi:hypothetical protein
LAFESFDHLALEIGSLRFPARRPDDPDLLYRRRIPALEPHDAPGARPDCPADLAISA